VVGGGRRQGGRWSRMPVRGRGGPTDRPGRARPTAGGPWLQPGARSPTGAGEARGAGREGSGRAEGAGGVGGMGGHRYPALACWAMCLAPLRGLAPESPMIVPPLTPALSPFRGEGEPGRGREITPHGRGNGRSAAGKPAAAPALRGDRREAGGTPALPGGQGAGSPFAKGFPLRQRLRRTSRGTGLGDLRETPPHRGARSRQSGSPTRGGGRGAGETPALPGGSPGLAPLQEG